MMNAAIPPSDRQKDTITNNTAESKPRSDQQSNSSTVHLRTSRLNNEGLPYMDHDMSNKNWSHPALHRGSGSDNERYDEEQALISSSRPKFTIEPITSLCSDCHRQNPPKSTVQNAHTSTLIIPTIKEPPMSVTDKVEWTGNQSSVDGNKQYEENSNIMVHGHLGFIHQIENDPVSMSTSTVATSRTLSIPPADATYSAASQSSHTGLRSVKSAHKLHNVSEHLASNASAKMHRTSSYVFGDVSSNNRIFADTTSIRSLASIGMGSTDGKKMVIRRVPTSPIELLKIVDPQPAPFSTLTRKPVDVRISSNSN